MTWDLREGLGEQSAVADWGQEGTVLDAARTAWWPNCSWAPGATNLSLGLCSAFGAFSVQRPVHPYRRPHQDPSLAQCAPEWTLWGRLRQGQQAVGAPPVSGDRLGAGSSRPLPEP